MRIVHLNALSWGGAARAVLRLDAALRQAGHESVILVPRQIEPGFRTFEPSEKVAATLARRWRRKAIRRDFEAYRATRPAGVEAFSDDRSEFDADVLAYFPPADVINLHWAAGFIDSAALPGLARIAPLVWTLHDMNPLTGGCHYDDGCGRFVGRCGACPQLGSADEQDLSRQVWERKRRAFGSPELKSLTFVAASRWMAAEVGRSSLLSPFRVATIPLGVDESLFRPYDKAAARKVLGIDADAAVVMFAADYASRRKGFALAAEALQGLTGIPRLVLLSVGNDQVEVAGATSRILGYVRDDRLLAMAYSAADVFVAPSLQESFGQTIVEAAACGTPTVAFDVGGIADIVVHRETGWLVPRGDVASLREAIRSLVGDTHTLQQMGARARLRVCERFTLQTMARAYLELYASLHHPKSTQPSVS